MKVLGCHAWTKEPLLSLPYQLLRHLRGHVPSGPRALVRPTGKKRKKWIKLAQVLMRGPNLSEVCERSVKFLLDLCTRLATWMHATAHVMKSSSRTSESDPEPETIKTYSYTSHLTP